MSDADTKPDVLSEDEFYMDGPYVVFTAAYHLRRGSCCHSDCRHCPYPKEAQADGPANPTAPAD